RSSADRRLCFWNRRLSCRLICPILHADITLQHGKATTPQAETPYRYITMPTIILGARSRGVYNSRGNQFALLGGANPIALNILKEGGR
ncbi:hypothetical protein HAX54_015001, partial [Datura stramonium]|nr:hypothetical protein [Datura stramonium]